MLKFQPFGDRVLIEVIATTEESCGGLLVKPVSKYESNKGLVVEVGEGTILSDGTIKPLVVQKGDKVLFNHGTGLSYEDEGKLFRIIPVREVLGKIVEDENE